MEDKSKRINEDCQVIMNNIEQMLYSEGLTDKTRSDIL
jgi:hypothetical protein